MKKLLALSLAIMLVLGVAGYVFAEGTYTREPGFSVSIEAQAHSSVTLSSTVVAGNNVFGFAYTDSAAGTGGIYDEASAGGSVTATIRSYCLGEISVAAGGMNTLMFPFPRKLVRGLVYRGTTTTGVISVFYE